MVVSGEVVAFGQSLRDLYRLEDGHGQVLKSSNFDRIDLLSGNT